MYQCQMCLCRRSQGSCLRMTSRPTCFCYARRAAHHSTTTCNSSERARSGQALTLFDPHPRKGTDLSLLQDVISSEPPALPLASAPLPYVDPQRSQDRLNRALQVQTQPSWLMVCCIDLDSSLLCVLKANTGRTAVDAVQIRMNVVGQLESAKGWHTVGLGFRNPDPCCCRLRKPRQIRLGWA